MLCLEPRAMTSLLWMKRCDHQPLHRHNCTRLFSHFMFQGNSTCCKTVQECRCRWRRRTEREGVSWGVTTRLIIKDNAMQPNLSKHIGNIKILLISLTPSISGMPKRCRADGEAGDYSQPVHDEHLTSIQPNNAIFNLANSWQYSPNPIFNKAQWKYLAQYLSSTKHNGVMFA